MKTLLIGVLGITLFSATGAGAETLLERGNYLMNGIVACGNCHTPQGPQGPVPGMELAGGMEIPEPGVFLARVPNITPDPETGIGAWTDDQIKLAIREGKRPDGTLIGPPMPIVLYRGLADDDLNAIVAYLRQVAPLKNKVGRSEYQIPLPPSYGPAVGSVPSPDRSDPVAYGAYLAGPAGHCIECHSSPGPNGAPDLVNALGAGKFQFHGPWGVSVSPNITPTGLGRYSDGEVKKMITTGVRPDGSRLMPPMGIGYYATLTGADLDALVAYLRSLPAK